MPSPMIYQDLTTTALLSHAAQYHSETEIVSVGAGGEKERSSWGKWPAALSGWHRRWRRWGCRRVPAAPPSHGTIAATWRSILPSPPAAG